MQAADTSLAVLVLCPAPLDGGGLRVEASSSGIRKVDLQDQAPAEWGDLRQPRLEGAGRAARHLERALVELERYFSGRGQSFSVSLDFDRQGTAFQRRVWEILQTIPWGATAGYLDVARRAGLTGGARAVGQAVAKNPVPLFVPCHRVVGSGGRLTGFSCGLRLKWRLLALEGVELAPAARLADAKVSVRVAS